MPGPGEEVEAERRIESTERGGDKKGGGGNWHEGRRKRGKGRIK